MPLVSVIIVSWNAKTFLLKCLETLSSKACRYEMEIVVVDNASSDGSADAVEQTFPGVLLLRNTSNTGFAKANNYGIQASSGEYLCLINSDVEVREDCLTRLIDFLEAHPKVGMAGPHITGGDGNLQRSCRGFPTVWNMFCRAWALDKVWPRWPFVASYSMSFWDHDDTREVQILSGCFWAIRRSALKDVGLLDEAFFMYGEDMDWCKRFWKAGWKLVFVPTAKAIHYGGASSSNAPVRFFIERHRADLNYWRKHHSSCEVRLYYLMTCLHLLFRVIGYWFIPNRGGPQCLDRQYKRRRSVAALRFLASVPLADLRQ
jgi:GT2 family glycosyltransferase